MTQYLYLVPNWFFGLSIFLEIVYAIFAAIVAVYSYKVYRLSEQRESKLFTIAFGSIALSYIIKAMINLFVLSEVQQGVRQLSLEGLTKLSIFSVYFHILLFVAGFVTLAYITFRSEGRWEYLLLLTLSLLPIIIGKVEVVAFNLVIAVLTGYICGYYFLQYKRKKNYKTALILTAFVLLFFSSISFIIAPEFYANFVIAHLLELGAYILILSSLVLTIRGK